MRHFIQSLSIRSIACAGCVALATLSGSIASAGYQPNYAPKYGVAPSAYHNDHHHKPTYYFKEITVYEIRQIPEAHWVTKYDHYNKPYQVKVIKIRTIKVPVIKRVKVAY